MSSQGFPFSRVVLIDIDGLKSDVFQQALAEGRIPHLARLFGGPQLLQGAFFEACANAPSITYSCQASSVTGVHPSQHLIPGNMFFDRFGRNNHGKPRYYQFDFLDAPRVFGAGLASQVLNPAVPTLFETAAAHGKTSTVAYHMYARGAQNWLKPGIDDWALFTQMSKPEFGRRYDALMIQDVLQHLQDGGRPDVLLMYMFGLDHESHIHGPGVQMDYLTQVIDLQMEKFLAAYQALGLLEGTLFCVFSDHGQIAIRNDDRHALKVGSFLDREYGYVFQALDLDVNDYLLEGANCSALLAQAGGMAQVYQRKKGGAWADPPPFGEVLQLARAFWDSNTEGAYSPELKNALELIMLRNVERDGWNAAYQVYTPQGLLPLTAYLQEHTELDWVDAPNRLHHMTSTVTGDLLLFANAAQGYSFSLLPYLGMHGGLYPTESNAVLAYGFPGATPEHARRCREFVDAALQARCQAENNRRLSNVDVAFGIRQLMGW